MEVLSGMYVRMLQEAHQSDDGIQWVERHSSQGFYKQLAERPEVPVIFAPVSASTTRAISNRWLQFQILKYFSSNALTQ